MVEFTLAGVASIFILIGTFSAAMGMWSYYTLPPSTNHDNRVGKYVNVSAVFQYGSPLLFFWPGAGARFGEVWLPQPAVVTAHVRAV